MDSRDAMAELTTDVLSCDYEYGTQVILDYLAGDGILSPGWGVALVSEIRRLQSDIDRLEDELFEMRVRQEAS